MAGFLIAGAFGCQAILGIDDTSFTPNGDAGSSGDGAAGDASTDGSLSGDGPSSGSISLSPATVRIAPGGFANVGVHIARNGNAGDISVTADGLDGGVGIAPITIADGTSDGTLLVTVTASAAFGEDVPQVRASLPGSPSAPLTVVIPGIPGTIDTTFANGEAAFTPGDAGTDATAVAVGVQSDQQVILGIQAPFGSGWIVVRLTSAGVVDATFDANAQPALPIDGALEDLVIGTHDDIWITGTSSNGVGKSQMTVVHLNADGTRDNAFGTNGVTRLDSISYSQGSTGTGIAVQSGNRAVACGQSATNGEGLVVRFDGNGTPDNTFGDGSSRELGAASQTFNRIVALPDDRLAIGGNESNHQLVFHLTKDGQPDTAFSPTGAVDGTVLPVNGKDITFRPDAGYIVVGGDNGGSGSCALSTFALVGDASVESDFQPPGSTLINASCDSATTQPDGLFLVTGNGGGSFDHTTFLERLIDLDTVDPTFADGGGVVFFADHSSGGTVPYRYFYDVAIGPDGRILVVGSQQSAGVLALRVWP